jgi:hypothetical protein
MLKVEGERFELTRQKYVSMFRSTSGVYVVSPTGVEITGDVKVLVVSMFIV